MTWCPSGAAADTVKGNEMDDTFAGCCVTPVKSTSGRLPTLAAHNRLMMAGGAVVIGGLALNWGWLTAIGVAPILLAVAPCGIMCALGLCAMGMKTPPRTSNAPYQIAGALSDLLPISSTYGENRWKRP